MAQCIGFPYYVPNMAQCIENFFIFGRIPQHDRLFVISSMSRSFGIKKFWIRPKNFLCKFTILYGPYLVKVARPVVLKKTFLSLGTLNSRLVFDTQLDKANLLASKISGFGPKKLPM